ncbi:MAG TPA: putative toxin-antitoxin system toxin component, PIN family [Dehalococcoidia bacterium]|nr:putative toxin-antitoxin system toxin component, PIN family [Dehalococcoidia bacterium]
MRVVHDANIVVSRYLVPVGIPAQVMAAWRAQRYDLIISPALMSEYEDVLNRPRIQRRHGLTPEQVASELTRLARFAILVEPAEVPAVIVDDPDDDQVLAAAVAGEADFIVSGDRHLLSLREYRGIRILSPAGFLALLASQEHAEL